MWFGPPANKAGCFGGAAGHRGTQGYPDTQALVWVKGARGADLNAEVHKGMNQGYSKDVVWELRLKFLPWKAFFAPSLEQDCCLWGQECRAGFHQAAPRAMGTWTGAHSSPFQVLKMAGEYSLNTEYNRIFFSAEVREYMELPWKNLMVYKVKWQLLSTRLCFGHPAFLFLVVWSCTVFYRAP